MKPSSLRYLALSTILFLATSATKVNDKEPNNNQPAGNVVSLTIHFNIDNDDKEHQDAVALRLYNLQEQQVFLNEIVPPMDQNGDAQDANAFYWPKDGPGRHEHVYTVPLPAPMPAAAMNGYVFQIISGYTSGKGDFQSWNATVNLNANLNTGAAIALKFCSQNGQTSAQISYANGNPKPGGNQTWECRIYTY
jgi:hypothetical protein